MKNIVKEVSESVLTSTVIKGAASATAAAISSVGASTALKALWQRKVAQEDKGHEIVKFRHITSGLDGIYCTCGMKHRYNGHLVSAQDIPLDLMGQVYNVHKHKAGYCACLAKDCLSTTADDVTDESYPLT